MYDFLSHYELARDIGTQYEYSNLRVGLLGELLANRVKMSYDVLLRERITKPLGMTHTSVVLGSDQLSAFATGHDLDGNAVSAWDLPIFAGAGGDSKLDSASKRTRYACDSQVARRCRQAPSRFDRRFCRQAGRRFVWHSRQNARRA